MMRKQTKERIEALIERDMAGKATMDEQQELVKLLESDDVPDELKPYEDFYRLVSMPQYQPQELTLKSVGSRRYGGLHMNFILWSALSTAAAIVIGLFLFATMPEEAKEKKIVSGRVLVAESRIEAKCGAIVQKSKQEPALTIAPKVHKPVKRAVAKRQSIETAPNNAARLMDSKTASEEQVMAYLVQRIEQSESASTELRAILNP